PLSWVKQIQENATFCQKIPLWGSSPPFPWEKISEAMQKKLENPHFQLLPSTSALLEPKDFLTPFGAHPLLLFFQLSPLPGYITWILSSESMEKISSLLLSKEENKGFSDPKLQEGFYQFLLLQLCEEVDKTHIYPDLHIQWLDDKKLPEDPSLAVDLSIKLEESSFLGRLIISSDCHTAFSDHFSKTPASYSTSPSYAKIDVPLSLEIGSCLLSQNEWLSLKVGDLLLLDRCSYDPITDKGSATLSLAEQPCFIVKIKKNGLKILDYAVYHGDINTMDEKFTPDSFEEETPLPKPEKDSSLLPQGEEEETFDTPSSEEVDDEHDSPKEEEPSATQPPEVLTSPGKIPFPIVVEVDRIKMSLEKILQLTPGNIIELDVHPNQGVYLTVHGKKIARGELIKIGEVLGVKITETGDSKTS
ncbi:MAG: type III secretion system cytoplasmic ring protein SctQ, partial [Verrucomicrobia bacterium]|nr:type III secretion system cytoplasmic ring protein SctQ [Verrucomicrobiota bacterium]